MHVGLLSDHALRKSCNSSWFCLQEPVFLVSAPAQVLQQRPQPSAGSRNLQPRPSAELQQQASAPQEACHADRTVKACAKYLLTSNTQGSVSSSADSKQR